MAKINQLRLDQLGIDQITDLVNEVNQCEPYHVPLESDGSTPPGFGIDRISAPLGFKGLTLPTVSPVRKVKVTKGLTSPSAVKRVTRSQVKKGRK